MSAFISYMFTSFLFPPCRLSRLFDIEYKYFSSRLTLGLKLSLKASISEGLYTASLSTSSLDWSYLLLSGFCVVRFLETSSSKL